MAPVPASLFYYYISMGFTLVGYVWQCTVQGDHVTSIYKSLTLLLSNDSASITGGADGHQASSSSSGGAALVLKMKATALGGSNTGRRAGGATPEI